MNICVLNYCQICLCTRFQTSIFLCHQDLPSYWVKSIIVQKCYIIYLFKKVHLALPHTSCSIVKLSECLKCGVVEGGIKNTWLNFLSSIYSYVMLNKGFKSLKFCFSVFYLSNIPFLKVQNPKVFAW